jgi:hypothetical protein
MITDTRQQHATPSAQPSDAVGSSNPSVKPGRAAIAAARPPAPEVTDGIGRLSQYILDHGFLCAIVVCGHHSTEKTAFTHQLASFTGSTVLDKTITAPRSEQPRYADRGWPDPRVYPTLMKTGFRIARHRPVVIDAPCLSYIRAASTQHISLAEHLQRCTREDLPIATAWVAGKPHTNTPQPLRDRVRDVVDLIISPPKMRHHQQRGSAGKR